MDAILKELHGKDDVIRLVHEWYKKDENAVPPDYVLQPISSGIPQYETETGKKGIILTVDYYHSVYINVWFFMALL